MRTTPDEFVYIRGSMDDFYRHRLCGSTRIDGSLIEPVSPKHDGLLVRLSTYRRSLAVPDLFTSFSESAFYDLLRPAHLFFFFFQNHCQISCFSVTHTHTHTSFLLLPSQPRRGSRFKCCPCSAVCRRRAVGHIVEPLVLIFSSRTSFSSWSSGLLYTVETR